ARAGEEAADDRADHARGPEDGEEVALVAGPLAGRDDVADDREREREEPARTDPLQGAERRELVHALGDPAQRRADDEDGDREEKEGFTTVNIGKLPVERR